MVKKRLILASASPRRKELLQDINIPFEVIPSSIDEKLNKNLRLEEAIEQLAYDKAYDVFCHHKDAVVLGCDTMVCIDGKALGKPSCFEDAKRMLKALQGNTHQVISGVAILSSKGCDVFHEVTNVTFYDMEETELLSYLDSEEPYDKAGAYGIQGKGKLFVKKIEGDYFNVVGLPIARVYRMLLQHIDKMDKK